MTRSSLVLLFTIAVSTVLFAPRFVTGAERVSLSFETHGLDLDTGTLHGEPATFDVFANHPEADIRVGYHADRLMHAVVIHNVARDVQLALLANTSFQSVDAANLPGLVFNTELVDQPFNPGDTLVMRTDTGSHFKIGNAVEEAAGVSFDYEALDATTAGLLGGHGTRSRNATKVPAGLTGAEWNEIQARATELEYGARGGASPLWLIGFALLAGVAAAGWLARTRMPYHSLSGRAALGLVVIASVGALTFGIVRAFEQAKLTASDAANGDAFGFSVSVDGDTVLVGANADDDDGDISGSAYVFVRSGGSWLQQAKLTASDAAARDQFGHSVSLDGDTALVGARVNDDDGINSGSAYVFVRSGATWTQQAKLTASDAAAFDLFGFSVSVNGDTALIGALFDDVSVLTNSGSAYVFVRNGATWSEDAKLTASDAAALDRFGTFVSVDGDTALVGAPDDDAPLSNSGSAHVFVRSGAIWSEQAKLTAGDAASSDRFGISGSVSGDVALIGAPDDDDAGSSSGSAYVFVRSGASWSEQVKLTASDGASPARFGISVSVDGDTALVGALLDQGTIGAAYVFTRNGTSWGEQAKLTASDSVAGDLFGNSVSVDAATALVGAPFGTVGGSAYIFEITPPTPKDLIEVLVSDVVSLGLPRGSEKSLLASLNNAIKKLDQGNTNAAVNNLQAFINKVEAQRGKKISEADADQLIANAQAIIDLLDGTP